MKIIGIKIINNKIIKNSKGDIRKFLNKKSKVFQKFGEIYFSCVKKNKIKGWNYHKKNRCLISLVSGKIELNFLDERKNSKTYKIRNKVILHEKKNTTILVPPKIWFCIKSLGKNSILVNLLDNIHTKSETKKKQITNI